MKLAATATPCRPPGAPLLLDGDWAASFRAAAAAGCAGIELHVRHAEQAEPRRIRQLMAEFSLAVPTVGTGLAAGQDGLTFADPDCSIRAAAVERVCGHVELAAEIGSAVIVGLVSGKLGLCEDEVRRERRMVALECLEAVCRNADRLGVTVLLEPLNRYECDYINTLGEAAAAVGEIGGGNLRLLADTFHMNIEETSMISSLAGAGALIGHVHLADSNRQAPGHGHLDVAYVLQTLRRLGYAGWISLEILPLPDPIDALTDGIAAIRSALQLYDPTAG